MRSSLRSDAGLVKEDIEVTHLASGIGHAMIAYRDRRSDEEKIFAIGRNESGQLGLGYNSQVRERISMLVYSCRQPVKLTDYCTLQEPTRGLVEGFQGDHIEDIKCGITSTYIQVRQGGEASLTQPLVTTQG